MPDLSRVSEHDASNPKGARRGTLFSSSSSTNTTSSAAPQSSQCDIPPGISARGCTRAICVWCGRNSFRSWGGIEVEVEVVLLDQVDKDVVEMGDECSYGCCCHSPSRLIPSG